jgi:hypothetical protein
MGNPFYFVRPDEDWVRTATITATSEQTGYEATKAGTDDPSSPWWANSGSATLTVTLSGSKEVGLIALIMTNADDAKTITIAGGITGSPTLTGARWASGFPKDLVYLVDPPQTLSAVTFAISGNTNKWSIGRVVIGKARTLSRNFVVNDFTPSPSRLQYSDENDFGHDIRYDLGVERWTVDGTMRLYYPGDLATLDAWWSATKGGYLPTLISVNSARFPPMFVRMTKELPRKDVSANFAEVGVSFTEVSKGLEVVG